MRKKYFTEEARKAAKRENVKRYYASDKGKEWKSAYDKAYREENRDRRRAYSQQRRKSKDGYIDRFLERAKEKTPDTDLSRDFLYEIFSDSCAITNKEFVYEKDYDAYLNPLAPSIDRVDSKIGYYKGNVQIVLACINKMKGDMPNDKFLELWKALTSE